MVLKMPGQDAMLIFGLKNGTTLERQCAKKCFNENCTAGLSTLNITLLSSISGTMKIRLRTHTTSNLLLCVTHMTE